MILSIIALFIFFSLTTFKAIETNEIAEITLIWARKDNRFGEYLRHDTHSNRVYAVDPTRGAEIDVGVEPTV